MLRSEWLALAKKWFLDRAGSSLREGRLDDLRSLVEEARADRSDEASHLNVAGLMFEIAGDQIAAEKLYRRAIRADRSFAPAQQNLRRQYELRTLGATQLPLAIGDALTDLWLSRLRVSAPPVMLEAHGPRLHA